MSMMHDNYSAIGPNGRSSPKPESNYTAHSNYPPLLLNRQTTPGGHVVDVSQPGFPNYHRKLGNPAPLGLSAFALTTFVLSLINAQARSVTTPNIIVGLALAYGGFVQLLAGMWEFACGNTFGATAFSSYGGFWISFGIIFWPSSGILDAYAQVPDQLESVLAFYLWGWFVFTSLCLIGCSRSSVALIALFAFLDITFFFLAIGKMNPSNANLTKIGGYLGVITAFIAWYNAIAGMLTPTTAWFTLPTGVIKKPSE